ncbi:AraC family transcriptional regulator [Paenibacillus fonticola]|uniref:AraC family transcriptional regulator n=1 Tax=Paenibacillus fonticola TaxID=379896 RepID=UPI00037B198F|nr:AraC family transcriptional regulator [Paenibacillus fonticola]
MRNDSKNSVSLPDKSHRNPLADIRDFMIEHYDKPLSIGQLANMAGLSPKYFVDLFKKTYGQSAMDFLTDLRINRAKRYLCETDYLHKEIAQKVGYSDEFYFSRKFKQKVGVSPTAYTRNPRKRIAAASASAFGQLLALDVVPVAAPLDSKWTPYYYNRYYSQVAAPLQLTEMQQGEWSKLIQSCPDVVISHQPLPEQLKEKLGNSALPFFVPEGQTSWHKQLEQIASFLGREKQCEAWLDAYRQKAEKSRMQLEKVIGQDVCLALRLYGRAMHAYCNQGIHDVLCEDLNINLSVSCDRAGFCNEELSMEQLYELDPDRIMLFVCPETATRAYWLSLQHNKKWLQLKAVRKGYVYLIPSDPWFEYSAVAVNRILDEMLLMFTGYCPGSLLDHVHGRSYVHDL